MRNKVALSVVVVGIVVLALVPFIDGLIFKGKFTELAAAINQDKNMKLEIMEYHLGWFHSHAKLHLTYLNQTPNSFLRPEFNSVIIEEKITHGPIVKDLSTHRFALAYGKMNTQFHMSNLIENMLFGANANKGFLQVSSFLGMNGEWKNNLVVLPIHMTVLNNKMDWDGLSGSIDFTIADQRISQLNINMNIAAFHLNGKGSNPFVNSVEVMASSYQNDSIRQPIGLWNGSSQLDFPGAKIYRTNGQLFALDQIKVAAQYGVENNDYHVQWQFDAKNILTANDVIAQLNPFAMHLNLNHLSATGLLALFDAARNSRNAAMNDRRAILENKILATITPRTQLNFEVNLNSNLGGFALTTQLNSARVVFPVQSLDAVMNQLNTTVTIKIAVGLLEKLIITQSGTPQQPVAQVASVTPTVNTQQVPTPADKMHEQINTMIKQGYIKQIGNDYVVKIEHDQSGIKLNGLVFNPQTLIPPVTQNPGPVVTPVH